MSASARLRTPMLALAVMLASSAGCRSQGVAGALHAQSRGNNPLTLEGKFTTAYFLHDPAMSTSFMLCDLAVQDALDGQLVQGQMLHLELLWLPKPGATPMDRTATNASIRLIVIAGVEVGVYGGAGFARPEGGLDHDRVTLTLDDASLHLQQSTPGFVDLLSPAQMTGTFTARRDDDKTRYLNAAASQLVTNALGRTTYVRR